LFLLNPKSLYSELDIPFSTLSSKALKQYQGSLKGPNTKLTDTWDLVSKYRGASYNDSNAFDRHKQSSMQSATETPATNPNSRRAQSGTAIGKIENNLLIMNYNNQKDAPLYQPSPIKSKQPGFTCDQKMTNLSLRSSDIITKYGSSRNFGLYNKKEIRHEGETKTILEIRPATAIGKKVPDANKLKNRPVTAYRANFNNKNMSGSAMMISPSRGSDTTNSKGGFFYDKYVQMKAADGASCVRKGNFMSTSASSKNFTARMSSGLGGVENLGNEINSRRGLVPRFGLASENEKIATRQFVFCGNCKKNLGPGNRVIPHNGPDGKEEKSGACDVVFVKRFDWVKMDPYSMSAKIQCPGCHYVIGDSKLGGVKCGCGHHEVPGYSLLKNKILFK
jgi:hypothetical protein